jgi:hypothetical protein
MRTPSCVIGHPVLVEASYHEAGWIPEKIPKIPLNGKRADLV